MSMQKQYSVTRVVLKLRQLSISEIDEIYRYILRNYWFPRQEVNE